NGDTYSTNRCKSQAKLPTLQSDASYASSLTVHNSGSIHFLNGPVQLIRVDIPMDGTATLTATTLQLHSVSVWHGTGTIAADVINGGKVSPGNDGTAGTLSITGNYTQTYVGTFFADIGGTTAGTQYDQLVVSGAINLDGGLVGNQINSFV